MGFITSFITLLLTLTASAAVSIPDRYITINSVELPLYGTDPNDMKIVVNMKTSGCRAVAQPLINRNGNYIQIFPRSQALKESSSCRAPASNGGAPVEQSISLGRLAPGTYKVRVMTDQSRVAKILNIYQ